MDTATFTAQSVIGMQPEIVFAKINAEIDTATARKYGVTGYPTLILMDNQGKEVDRILGFYEPDTFKTTIINYLAGIGTLADLEQQLSQDLENANLTYQVADKYVGRSEWPQARKLLDRVVTIDPRNASGVADDAMYTHARTFYKEERWDDAISGFRLMVKNFPESELAEDAEIYVPYIYAKAGNTQEALQLYRNFLERHPDSDEVEWVNKQITKIENPDKEDGS